MTQDEQGGPAEKPAAGDKQRRARIDALKRRRQSLALPKRDLGAIMSQASPGGGQDVSDAQAGGQQGNLVPDFLLKMATGQGELPPVQKQIFMYVHKVLTQLPPQQDDTIPGTSFTYFGVEQLMTLLSERAQDPGAKGAKAAGMALQFLEAHDGEEAISGASLEKLKMLSNRAEMMQSQRGNRGGARRG